jgi:ABC-2 type transport system permease protein
VAGPGSDRLGILTEARHSPRIGWLRRLWAARASLLLLVRSDLHKRYTQFRLGYIWSVLEPAVQIVVLWAVFTLLLGRERALGYQPFLLFVATGILPWTWVTGCITRASKVSGRKAVRIMTSAMPRRAWPLEVVAVGFIQFLLVWPLYLVFAAITMTPPTAVMLVAMPAAIIMQFILLYGLALIVMPLVAIAPDSRNVIAVIMRVMFYVSPIIYAVSRVPESLQPFTIINPLTGILSLYRVGFWPEEALLPWTAYAITLAICLGVLAFGLIFFRRMEHRMVRELL